MRLSKLQLQGFKTFAERTEISFSDGVTAIVGPNGSGKSNLGDAILWVLGDKASSLRGAKATDVIFAGTDKRRPTGMAEVSLTVDNSDGALPVAFAEVTVTRRAYRTGDAEYFLNKVPCRLKDIAELFLDTGVGRDSYALVGQSQIDAVLSADPAERRGLFEEAAGIKKYRVQKRDALRKLEATEANSVRVADILSEMSGRMEPLRLAAERATRFAEAQERLRSIETGLLITDVRFAHAQWDAARRERTAHEDALAAAAVALGDAEGEAQRIAALLADAEARTDAVRSTAQGAATAAERAEGARLLAVQRAESLRDAGRVRAGERDELSARRDALDAQIGGLAAERGAAGNEEQELHTLSVRQGADVHKLGEQIALLSRQEEARRRAQADAARQAAAREGDAARAEARASELERGLPGLQSEAERLRAAVQGANAGVDAAKTAVDGARLELTRTDGERAKAQAARDGARQAAQDAQAELRAAQSDLLSAQTRLLALQELEDAQEGYFAGVRAVQTAARAGTLTGTFTTVADAFHAPPGYETAFEVALAASLQDIITDTEASAKAAIAFLHDGRLGRATFLPLDRMRPNRDALDLGRAANMDGVRGAALDIATFEEKFRPALDVLLGRVFVCDTLDDALAAAKLSRGWNRIVTLSGELVLPSGALTGGRQAGKTANLLGRKTEISQLTKRAASGESDVDGKRDTSDAANLAAHNADAALQAATGARQAAASVLGDGERRLTTQMQEARRLAEALTVAERRMAQAQGTLDAAREGAKRAAALLLPSASVPEIDDADAVRDELRSLSLARDAAQNDLTGTRIRLAAAEERGRALERSVRAARADLDALHASLLRRERDAEGADAQAARLLAQADALLADGTQAAATRAQAEKELEMALGERGNFAAQGHALSVKMRQLAEARAAASELLHKTELRETRLEAQVGATAARLRDEYDMALADALALPEDPDVPHGAAAEAGRLRRELKQMGAVNTGATEEWEQTRTRFEFLTAQKADLDGARARLLDAIKEIDDSTRGVFLDTFHAVGAAFGDIFARLFGGGKTELSLTTPDDILETGIDVLVQPPGKKRQSLALLSGGERALTAAALLFAFLTVRPAPFCVLDEVDAPLDGANVERFADLLREFGKRSQMIVITHNPTTMEAAPLWYGITMPEAGVSRVLSMKVPDTAAA